ncbi:hypothetical protein RM543_12220 [Roseicyclus sp. F158]|uniref:Uncharacterized protein n=1 Tax=Tropicimonas omnivorans TaxID=3075590 RepID=A0ABU3DIB5_9RHOB|nr:hypothetical protein [Roseicyclus sp. F158]MDT0683453.1 hypothetical protein [Roseicyclus sp. F158]
MSKSKLFGYWISLEDRASARNAVRMSGLPVLLMGANAALLALVSSVRPFPDMAVVSSAAAIAALLVLMAFRIRAGHAAWIPFASMLFIAFLGVSLFSSYIGWQVAGGNPTTGAQILLGWIIPAICLILMVSGLRGWFWMRQNTEKLSF